MRTEQEIYDSLVASVHEAIARVMPIPLEEVKRVMATRGIFDPSALLQAIPPGCPPSQLLKDIFKKIDDLYGKEQGDE